MSNLFHVQSPIGYLAIRNSQNSILEIKFLDENPLNITAPEIPIQKTCYYQLEDYFTGKRTHFSLTLEPEGTDFQHQVWNILQRIPSGSTRTYSDIAVELGDEKKLRAVGQATGRNKIPILIPCHRVIGKDHSLTGFAGGIERKKWLLEHEGVIYSPQMELF